ncbi:MAG: hypothetical protein JOZ19_01165 [Rubrobacter sp.]|nr:hypothetical protein [Rubrobacter sp.]
MKQLLFPAWQRPEHLQSQEIPEKSRAKATDLEQSEQYQGMSKQQEEKRMNIMLHWFARRLKKNTGEG